MTMAMEWSGEVVRARPGDTLLLITETALSLEHEARIRDAVEDRIPGVTVVIVGPVAGAVLYGAHESAARRVFGYVPGETRDDGPSPQ